MTTVKNNLIDDCVLQKIINAIDNADRNSLEKNVREALHTAYELGFRDAKKRYW